MDNIVRTRTYDLYITYDQYYQVRHAYDSAPETLQGFVLGCRHLIRITGVPALHTAAVSGCLWSPLLPSPLLLATARYWYVERTRLVFPWPQVPRFWLVGFDESRRPLLPQQVRGLMAVGWKERLWHVYPRDPVTASRPLHWTMRNTLGFRRPQKQAAGHAWRWTPLVQDTTVRPLALCCQSHSHAHPHNILDTTTLRVRYLLSRTKHCPLRPASPPPPPSPPPGDGGRVGGARAQDHHRGPAPSPGGAVRRLHPPLPPRRGAAARAGGADAGRRVLLKNSTQTYKGIRRVHIQG